MDKVAEQEATVTKFLEEHRPLLKEPELSFAVLEATYVQGAELLKSVSDELKRRQGPTVRAANALTDALNERPRVAPKIAKLEKKRKRLRGDFNRVNAAFELLEPFIAEVKSRLDAEYEEDGTPKVPEALPERSNYEIAEAYDQAIRNEHAVRSALETSKKLPWWKRLLGVHQEEPPEPRESSVAPSVGESDEERYEEFLGFYSDVLSHLQRVVAIRQKDPMVYENKPELAERWQKQYDEQLNHLAWADRNMDVIEESNPEIVSSGLVKRRENLASRRDEVAPDSF